MFELLTHEAVVNYLEDDRWTDNEAFKHIPNAGNPEYSGALTELIKLCLNPEPWDRPTIEELEIKIKTMCQSIVDEYAADPSLKEQDRLYYRGSEINQMPPGNGNYWSPLMEYVPRPSETPDRTRDPKNPFTDTIVYPPFATSEVEDLEDEEEEEHDGSDDDGDEGQDDGSNNTSSGPNGNDAGHPVVVSSTRNDADHPLLVSSTRNDADHPVVVSSTGNYADHPVVVSSTGDDADHPVVVSSTGDDADHPVMIFDSSESQESHGSQGSHGNNESNGSNGSQGNQRSQGSKDNRSSKGGSNGSDNDDSSDDSETRRRMAIKTVPGT